MKLVFFLFLLPLAFSQLDDLTVVQSGTCKDFTVNIQSDFQGCWDVKIDAPGQVLHEDGWKDTFFYLNNAMCDGSAELRVKYSSSSDFSGRLKLRQNSTILEKDFFVDQNCPAELSDEMTFGIVIVVILILFGAALWYMEVR